MFHSGLDIFVAALRNHATLQERLDQLEKAWHGQVFCFAKGAPLHWTPAAQGSHATLADRIGYIEQVMGDSFEKHAQAIPGSA